MSDFTVDEETIVVTEKVAAEEEKQIQTETTNDTVEKKRKEINVFEGLSAFGEYILSIIAHFFILLGKGIASAFIYIWKRSGQLRKGALKGLKMAGYFLLSPFLKIYTSFQIIGRTMSDAKKTGDRKIIAKARLNCIASILFGKKGLAVTVFNYSLPIISIMFLFNVVTYATNINYAVKLTVNGEFIGYIENEQVYSDAEIIMNERMSYFGNAETIKNTPEYSIEKIGYSETLSKYQVADLMLQNSGVSIEYAYGFYINDVFYGAVSDTSKIKETLDGLLEAYQQKYPDDECKFVDDIEYSTAGLYLTDSIIDADQIIKRITGTKSVARYYTVQDGDSHLLVGDKMDMTQAEIERLNPGFKDSDLHTGDKLMMNAEEPFLSISVTTLETYDVSVPYDSETYDDNSIYEGNTKVTTLGENGTNTVTALVSYVDGVETKRTVQSSKVVTEPITEEIAVGTKPVPSTDYSTDTAVDGQFIWPVAGGEISQWGWWDGGYYGHSGVDIAAPYGTSIYAGDSGTVIYSGWLQGYGKCIKIAHPNGLVTLYGHCSSLFVSSGEVVSQGQCIAAVGATGYAYGNHCHFEVRVGDYAVNPRPYLASINRINLVA